jgi:hypothetical protein
MLRGHPLLKGPATTATRGGGGWFVNKPPVWILSEMVASSHLRAHGILKAIHCHTALQAASRAGRTSHQGACVWGEGGLIVQSVG